MSEELRHLYRVVTSNDLTEGRGKILTLALTQTEATAKRLGHRQYVQGSNCPIEKVNLLHHEGKWYVPLNVVHVVAPSKEDEKEQTKIDNIAVAREKAKSLGLTDEDIRMLRLGV
jgi:hypothetical protein